MPWQTGDVVGPTNLNAKSGSGLIFNIQEAPFGAKGDGVTDDTAAIQAAITAAQNVAPATVFCPKPTASYLVNRLQITASNVAFTSEYGTTFTRTVAGIVQQGMLEANGAQTATTTTLTVTATIAATSLSVNSSTGFSAGDIIEIVSSKTLGSLDVYYEYNRVASTSVGVINLDWALRNTYSTAGFTITVTKLAPLTNIKISGGTWIGPGGSQGDCVRVKWCLDPVVEDITAKNHAAQGVVFHKVRGGIMNRCKSIDGLSLAGTSHGLALYTCENVLMMKGIARDGCYNGIDIGAGSMYNTIFDCKVIGSADVGFVCGHGEHAHHNLWLKCEALKEGNGGFQWGDPAFESDEDNFAAFCSDLGTANGGFKFKNGATRNLLYGCTSNSNTGDGISIDSSNTTCIDNDFIECICRNNGGHGISITARSRIVGGHHDSNTGNGIRVNGIAGSADGTVIDGAVCNSNTLDGIDIRNSANGVIRHPVTNGALGAHNGIIIATAAPGWRVIEPVARNNGAWGVNIVDVGGDTAGSVVVGGSYSGNVSGTVAANNIAVAFSATPTFDATSQSTFEMTLTAAVTSVTITNGKPGQTIYITFIQDGTGGRTVSGWNSNIKQAWSDAGNAAAKRSTIAFIVDGFPSKYNQLGAQSPYV